MLLKVDDEANLTNGPLERRSFVSNNYGAPPKAKMENQSTHSRTKGESG